jgi:Arc/MetJ-type ribon-helix-helix transcriptional regulator
VAGAERAQNLLSRRTGGEPVGSVLPLCYYLIMAVRKKRSVSIPPDLDAQIEAAAAEAGMTYSAWLAATARKEFIIRAGLKAVAEFEREQGAFSPEEIAEAEQWAREALERSTDRGSRRRRTA